MKLSTIARYLAHKDINFTESRESLWLGNVRVSVETFGTYTYGAVEVEEGDGTVTFLPPRDTYKALFADIHNAL